MTSAASRPLQPRPAPADAHRVLASPVGPCPSCVPPLPCCLLSSAAPSTEPCPLAMGPKWVSSGSVLFAPARVPGLAGSGPRLSLFAGPRAFGKGRLSEGTEPPAPPSSCGAPHMFKPWTCSRALDPVRVPPQTAVSPCALRRGALCSGNTGPLPAPPTAAQRARQGWAPLTITVSSLLFQRRVQTFQEPS